MKNGFPAELDVDAVSVAPTTAVTVKTWPLLVVRMTVGLTVGNVRLVSDAAVDVGAVVGAVVVTAALVDVGRALVVLMLVEVGTVLVLITDEVLDVVLETELEVLVEGWLVVLGGVAVVVGGAIVGVGGAGVVVVPAAVVNGGVFEIVLDPVSSWRLRCISASNLSLNTGDMVVE